MAKRTGITKKQQKQLVNTAAGAYNSLSATGQKIVTALVIIAIIAGGIWYFMFGGKAIVDKYTGNGSATTAVEVLPYGPEGTYDPTQWNAEAAPNYYRLAGEAVINHPEIQAGEIKYGELDYLGRATWACGVLNADIYAKELSEEREPSLPNPAGWPRGNNPEVDVVLYNGDVYHGNFYNRSHMIADSLGGEPILENLVTGTRMQNTGTNNQGNTGFGGMAFTEEEARQFLQNALDTNNGASLYYCVTPVYIGEEPLPRSVYVDVLSSDGAINRHVETFNCANGYNIDYSTAQFFAG